MRDLAFPLSSFGVVMLYREYLEVNDRPAALLPPTGRPPAAPCRALCQVGQPLCHPICQIMHSLQVRLDPLLLVAQLDLSSLMFVMLNSQTLGAIFSHCEDLMIFYQVIINLNGPYTLTIVTKEVWVVLHLKLLILFGRALDNFMYSS